MSIRRFLSNPLSVFSFYFILEKLIPFWIIGFGLFTFGLFVLARFVYGIQVAGSILTLYLFFSIYMIAMLGFGMFLSTYSQSQQQAMSLVFFFMMIFILMSGLFTSIESMPQWRQVVAHLNPVTYFIDVLRSIILKVSKLKDLLPQLAAIAVFAIVFNAWAVFNYKKTM